MANVIRICGFGHTDSIRKIRVRSYTYLRRQDIYVYHFLHASLLIYTRKKTSPATGGPTYLPGKGNGFRPFDTYLNTVPTPTAVSASSDASYATKKNNCRPLPPSPPPHTLDTFGDGSNQPALGPSDSQSCASYGRPCTRNIITPPLLLRPPRLHMPHIVGLVPIPTNNVIRAGTGPVRHGGQGGIFTIFSRQTSILLRAVDAVRRSG